MNTSAAEAERRDAACALLGSPFITAASDPAALKLVQRHAGPLKDKFKTLLGYRLVVEPSFARLVKGPLPAASPPRAADRGNGREFTPTGYMYLALVAAALTAPGIGEQVLLSDLVGQVRADAAEAGIPLGDHTAEVRELVAAIQLLTRWGVLAETDGTVEGWSQRRDEALLTVHRPLLPHLLAGPLPEAGTPEELWAAAPAAQPRLSLRRRIVEDPVVSREQLDPAELDVLSRERGELGRTVADSFGLVLEVRSEGLLGYHPQDGLTDISFPGAGTLRQAALLLLGSLLEQAAPVGGSTAQLAGREVAGVLCPWDLVDTRVAALARRHRAAWSGLADDPQQLRDSVVALLASVGLAAATPHGLVLHPAAARYRPTAAAPAADGGPRRPAPAAPGSSYQEGLW